MVGISNGNSIQLSDAQEIIEKYIRMRDIDFKKKGPDYIPKGPFMLRGIAGSGKTIQLCQRAVIAHKKNPDWKIALVFYNRSLYDTIRGLVRAYCGFLDINWDDNCNLKVLHGWGASDRPGLYRTIAEENGVEPLGVNDTGSYRNKHPDSLVYLCKQLLEERKLKQLFDMILIDEGQDMIVDDPELLFEGKQPLYWMAYESLRPVHSSTPEVRRLLWAFDEYQSLNCEKVPTSVELFGSDPTHRRMMQGRSLVLRVCYRTPLPILLAAHALGMGLYNAGGMISGPTNAKDWDSLGYAVNGTFRPGNKIELTRLLENSPNPIFEKWSKPLIYFNNGFSSIEEENNFTILQVNRLIIEKGIRPDDIMVISMNRNEGILEELWNGLFEHGVRAYVVARRDSDSINGKNPDKFIEPGAVTLSNLYKAKGNEANIVFLTHLEKVGEDSDNPSLRNSLFTGMTRSRGWLIMSGGDDYPFYNEIKDVLKDVNKLPKLSFVYRKPPRRKLDLFTDESALTGWQTSMDGDWST